MNLWSQAWPWVARLGLAGVLAWAGWAKARNPPLFALDIEAYRLVPGAIAVATAYYLPFVEIFAAVALFIRPVRRGGTLLALVLFTTFTAMLALAWARGLQINCGCFGTAAASSATNYAWSIARNALLFGLAVALFRRDSRADLKS